MFSKRALPFFLIAILWMAGANHCVIESIFSESESSREDCPAHAPSDSASHSEGQPCGAKQITTHRVALTSGVIDNASDFAALGISLGHVEDHVRLSTKHSILAAESPSIPISNRLVSLCIASNAPPMIA